MKRLWRRTIAPVVRRLVVVPGLRLLKGKEPVLISGAVSAAAAIAARYGLHLTETQLLRVTVAAPVIVAYVARRYVKPLADIVDLDPDELDDGTAVDRIIEAENAKTSSPPP